MSSALQASTKTSSTYPVSIMLTQSQAVEKQSCLSKDRKMAREHIRSFWLSDSSNDRTISLITKVMIKVFIPIIVCMDQIARKQAASRDPQLANLLNNYSKEALAFTYNVAVTARFKSLHEWHAASVRVFAICIDFFLKEKTYV